MGQTSAQQQPAVQVTPEENNEISFLSGYKTYIVAAIMVLYALTGWYLKALDQVQALTIIFNAAGIVGIRSGIESLKNI